MACQNRVVFVTLITIMFVMGAKVTVLAQSCKPGISTCIEILVLGDINQENECSIQSKYLPCLDTALQKATCDYFSLLALKYTAIQEYNYINSQSACNIVVPNQFQFNACTQQLAVCGQYINNAFDHADIRIRCSVLSNFEICLKSQTGNCNRTLVNDLSQGELSYFNYTTSCIVQQTTQRPAPSTTAPTTKAPTTPSLLFPSSTKIAPPPTPVTPSPTSRTSTSERTTTLPKPSSSLPNTILAQSCRPSISTCIQILVLGDINQENECSIQSKYLPCLDTALKNVKCDNFSLLALRYTAIRDYNTINSQSACNIVVPNQFQFDACTQQLAVCGQYINNAFDHADLRIRCSALGDFEICLKSQTGNCNRTLVNDLSQRELGYFNYSNSCIVTTTSSTAPSTKAKMTTTPTTTAPRIPSLSLTSSTKKVPTPVTPSPTSHTSTSERTTTLPKPSSSLPNTNIPVELQLDMCLQQMAKCGQHLKLAFTNGNRSTWCRSLIAFQLCMISQTGKCKDLKVIDILRKRELYSIIYQIACRG